MLASVENNCLLDVGINRNLQSYLPNGDVYEGQFTLTVSKIRKAIKLNDVGLFITTLSEVVAQYAYAREQVDHKKRFNIENIRFGLIPEATGEQKESLSDLSEKFILCFFSKCSFDGDFDALDEFVKLVGRCQGFKVRGEFLDCLYGRGAGSDYNSYFACLLVDYIHSKGNGFLPGRSFEFIVKAIDVSVKTNNFDNISDSAFTWLCDRWCFIWGNQRFQLKSPMFYGKKVVKVIDSEYVCRKVHLIELMLAILPLMGFNNENEVRKMICKFRGI